MVKNYNFKVIIVIFKFFILFKCLYFYSFMIVFFFFKIKIKLLYNIVDYLID